MCQNPYYLNSFWTLSHLGLSAPSASNPFQHEPQPRLTLNQMRPSSTSPLPTSLPFNASLPMAASNQPSSLPSTFTQSAQVPPLIPGHLPQPLLPLSTTSTLGDPDQHNQNPFLWKTAWADPNKLLKGQFNHWLDLKLEHTFLNVFASFTASWFCSMQSLLRGVHTYSGFQHLCSTTATIGNAMWQNWKMLNIMHEWSCKVYSNRHRSTCDPSLVRYCS